MTVMDANAARTHNMRRLVADAGGPAEFSRKYGATDGGEVRWSAAQVSQWISETSPKGIGRKLARSIEARLGLNEGDLDRVAASQPMTLDPAKLATSMTFVDDLADARGVELGLDARARLIAAVYAELLIETKPNVVEMTVRFSKQLEGGDDRQRSTGRIGKDDPRGAGEGARKAKAAVG